MDCRKQRTDRRTERRLNRCRDFCVTWGAGRRYDDELLRPHSTIGANVDDPPNDLPILG